MSDASERTPKIDLTDEAERAKLQSTIAVWERIVQVQMHFNDISLRIRNFLITVILATFGAAGFILNYNIKLLEVEGVSFSPLPLLFIASWVAIHLLYFMDRDWYHRLLKGAVEAAIPVEEKYRDLIPGLSLGTEISKASKLPVKDRWMLSVARLIRLVSTFDGSEHGVSVPSNGKLEFFYGTALSVMLIAALVSLFGGVYLDGEWWLTALVNTE